MSVIKLEFDTNDIIVTAALTAAMNAINERQQATPTETPAFVERMAESYEAEAAPTKSLATEVVASVTIETPTPADAEATVTISHVVKPELDTAGLPHDNRIHSRTKSTENDGTWKVSRKPKEYADKATWLLFVDSVRAESITPDAVIAPVDDIPTDAPSVFGAPVQEAVATPPPPPVQEVAPVQEAVATPPPPPVQEAVATPPPTPVQQVAPAQQAAATVTFGELMQHITANKIGMDIVTATCVKHGVASLPVLSQRKDLIPAVLADLQAV
jgi:hypothetical protein